MQRRLVLRGYAAPSKATRNGYGCNMGPPCEGCAAGRIDRAQWSSASTAFRCRLAWSALRDYGRDLAAGVEKRPTNRIQKARYRLVTLVNHTKLAGKRADADGL